MLLIIREIRKEEHADHNYGLLLARALASAWTRTEASPDKMELLNIINRPKRSHIGGLEINGRLPRAQPKLSSPESRTEA